MVMDGASCASGLVHLCVWLPIASKLMGSMNLQDIMIPLMSVGQHLFALVQVPGVPVLPVAIAYNKRSHNPAWTIMNEGWHFVSSIVALCTFLVQVCC